MGPLTGIRILEMAGLGPAPFCGMILADLGADVVRVDRPSGATASFIFDPTKDPLSRGRRSIAVDLKSPEGQATVLALAGKADAIIEGFRPGVMERLGLGPDDCFAVNPRLVYGRVTGWGQDGPLAQAAGHDINYISLAGVLHGIGRKGEAPVPPINLAGDYGGGALFLAIGVLSALLEARQSGKGQVVDAAMVDGAALLMTAFHGLKAVGEWRDERGVNLLDGGAFYYDSYETKDGKYMSLGALEDKFWAEFLSLAGLRLEDFPDRENPVHEQAYRAKIAALFRGKTRDEWTAIFAGSDACVAPVLSMTEAAEHPHMAARGVFSDRFGVRQPVAAPRFSRTKTAPTCPPPEIGADAAAVLKDWLG